MIKNIYVDADHMIYFIAENRDSKTDKDFDDLEDGLTEEDGFRVPLGPYKRKFMKLMEEYMEAVGVESIFHTWTPGEMFLIFSDPVSNFRHDLYSDYKGHRIEKPQLFYRLRRWAHRKFGVLSNLEADDVVGYWARKGHIVITTDKDVYKGCHGYFYNAHHFHKTWVRTSRAEAKHFNLIQTLCGDATDGIPGLPGVGKDTAEKWLGDRRDWEAVVSLYKGIPLDNSETFYTKKGDLVARMQKVREAGLTEEDAILTKRLVSMDQWTPEGGLQLWEKQ